MRENRLPGATLVVSRAKKLFLPIKKRLEDLGFPHVEVTGEERDSLNRVIGELNPRLVLMGSGFYQAGTPFMTGEILKYYPRLNIAAVSAYDFPMSLAVWFIWHGVKSYVNLWEGHEEFHRGLQEVRKGNCYISPRVRKMINQFSEWPDTKDKTTKRQMETLILLCNGLVPERIGEVMHVTRKTVNNHLEGLYSTFHVKNREEMVALAWDLGLVTEKDIRFIDRKQHDDRYPEWAIVKKTTDREVYKDDN